MTRHPSDQNDPYPEPARRLPLQPWLLDADPYEPDLEDTCWHEDYEADILTGITRCCSCNHSWPQTAREIKRERQAQIAWERQCEAWEREGMPPVAPDKPTGDDIPF